MQLHYIDTVIVRYDIAKVKIRVSGDETPIFAICSKYVDFFYGLGNCKLFIGLRTGCGSCVAAV